MKKKILLIICLLFFSGCGLNAEKRDMRINYDGKFSIVVEKNYQQVYRDFMSKIHNSSSMVWVGDQGMIENAIYTDIKTAYIRSCRVNAIMGEYNPSLIDIISLSDTSTKITIYYSYHNLDHKETQEMYEKYLTDMYINFKVIK